MSGCWLVWGTLILCQICAILAAKDDLDTAAITVYRNPEFFKHLSGEYNNHVNRFTTDSPPNFDEYHSPFQEDSHRPFPDLTFNIHSSENSNQQDYPESSENYKDDDYSSESEGGGFNTYNGNSEYGKIIVPTGKNEDEDVDGYKYPGEPKKPNPPGRPFFNVHFDRSPDFDHPSRDVPNAIKPKKKGRGPYGHPRISNHRESFGNNENDYPSYSQEYEDDKGKSEEENLRDIEEDSRKHREENPNDDNSNYQQELKIYHNGERFPISVETDNYAQTPLQDDFPVGHYDHYHDDHKHYDDYHPSSPSTESLQPIIGNRFNINTGDYRDKKKGTREYLKFFKFPANHELRDVKTISNKQNHNKKHVVSCNTLIRSKPKKYRAYKVQPLYSHYKVYPIFYKKHRTHYPIYKRSSKSRTSSKSKPKQNVGHGAYALNSELDQDYQHIRIIKNEKF